MIPYQLSRQLRETWPSRWCPSLICHNFRCSWRRVPTTTTTYWKVLRNTGGNTECKTNTNDDCTYIFWKSKAYVSSTTSLLHTFHHNGEVHVLVFCASALKKPKKVGRRVPHTFYSHFVRYVVSADCLRARKWSISMNSGPVHRCVHIVRPYGYGIHGYDN